MDRLGTIEAFPPATFVYMDAASVGLMHRGAALAINRWQQALADEGTIAFDEQNEVECLDNLNGAAAALLNTSADNIATASSETVLMASLAWAVTPPKGSNIVATETWSIRAPSIPWMRVASRPAPKMRWARSRQFYIDPDFSSRSSTRRLGRLPVPCRIRHRPDIRSRPFRQGGAQVMARSALWMSPSRPGRFRLMSLLRGSTLRPPRLTSGFAGHWHRLHVRSGARKSSIPASLVGAPTRTCGTFWRLGWRCRPAPRDTNLEPWPTARCSARRRR